MPLDDLGHPVAIAPDVTRIVSLVPSLTESIAATRPETLVGATDWCTHPADLDVTRIRGTKNPHVQAIIDLAPHLVLANKEENRELDVKRLRAAGVPVWVTDITTVEGAFTSLRRMFLEALRWDLPAWLIEAEAVWLQPFPAPRARAAIPIWRDPWMVVGSSTFTGDLALKLGLTNAFATSPDRYPHVELDQIDDPDIDLVLLPDEPYVFSADDGPEAFLHAPTRLVEGRLLTWYGPSLVHAHATLLKQIR
ncbi:helical backbone metal receptor [soil metagenome]